MRIFLVSVLCLSLFGVVSCGESPIGSSETEGKTTDGTGAADKPTDEEKRQFFEAKRRKIDITHKSAQILAVSEKTAVIRATVNVAGVDQFLTLAPPTLASGDVASFNRDVYGAQFEIILTRRQADASSVSFIGVEYRVSRSEMSRIHVASQFLRLKADKLNSPDIVTKQKFEYPSKTNLLDWIQN